MEFDINKSIEILERTPTVLTELFSKLDEDWTMNNEGGETWSAYDIIGHLIHGEHTDWMSRTEIILHKENKNFMIYVNYLQVHVPMFASEEFRGKSKNGLRGNQFV